jgi:hypothetical protein
MPRSGSTPIRVVGARGEPAGPCGGDLREHDLRRVGASLAVLEVEQASRDPAAAAFDRRLGGHERALPELVDAGLEGRDLRVRGHEIGAGGDVDGGEHLGVDSAGLRAIRG